MTREPQEKITLLLDIRAARKFAEHFSKAVEGYEEGLVTECGMTLPIVRGRTLEDGTITRTEVEVNIADLKALSPALTNVDQFLFILPEGVLTSEDEDE